TAVISTKREGAADQLEVASDGLITSHLILGPAQCMFDLLVTLLHPHAQPVESDHLFQLRRGERGWGGWRGGGSRQVRHEIPSREIRQGLRISGGHHRSFHLVWSVRSGHDL